MTAFDVVETAFVVARDAEWDWSSPISALPVVEALVDAGLAVDDQRGEASLEAKVERAYARVEDQCEGEWPWRTDLVAEAVLTELGLQVTA